MADEFSPPTEEEQMLLAQIAEVLHNVEHGTALQALFIVTCYIFSKCDDEERAGLVEDYINKLRMQVRRDELRAGSGHA